MQIAIAAVILAAFLWLIASALRGAWEQEQTWKAQDAEWTTAHPESQHADRQAIHWLPLLGVLGTLALVGGLIAVGLNVTQACVLAAVPVVVARYVNRQRREQEAGNREQFGDYSPSFRERR